MKTIVATLIPVSEIKLLKFFLEVKKTLSMKEEKEVLQFKTAQGEAHFTPMEATVVKRFIDVALDKIEVPDDVSNIIVSQDSTQK